MVDGYPLYGPFQAMNTLAQSCWPARDYSSSSATGCSTSTRCCQLKNQEDYTQGTTTVSCGPSLTGTTSTLSGNTISAASGIYIEDYYYNSSCSALGGVYLDKHNGHSHGTYGYHYHITISSASSWAGVFPYFVGPKLYGCRSSGSCCSSLTSQSCSSSGSVCGTSDGTTTHSCSEGSWSGANNMDDDSAGQPTAAPTSSGASSSSTSTGSGLSGQDKIIVIVVLTVVVGSALLVFVGRVMYQSSAGRSKALGQSEDIDNDKAALAMVEIKSGGRVLV
jgi:hypothetical protein